MHQAACRLAAPGPGFVTPVARGVQARGDQACGAYRAPGCRSGPRQIHAFATTAHGSI